MDDDTHIIERVLAGNVQAFRELVDAHQKCVFQFAYHLLRKFEDAEDLTQDVFVAAFQNLGSYQAGKSRFTTWLLTIARNRCLNHLKRRQVGLPGDLDVVTTGPTPAETVVEREIWQQLDRALDQLSLEQRTAFVLAEIQDLPYGEIALIEGIELGTVKSRVGRARERLRSILKSWRPDGKIVSLQGENSDSR